VTALGADVLAGMTVADPEFAANPAKFVSWATRTAARAHEGYRSWGGVPSRAAGERRKSAVFYTHVACLLADAAGSERGAVLAELVEDYGEPTPA
jgi:hypothetical protein